MNNVTDNNDKQPAQTWHALDVNEVLTHLKSDTTGLNEEEVIQRRSEYGSNRLPEGKPRNPIIRFLAQFHNLLIYILLVAAVVTLLLGHWVDTIVIVAVVFINSVISFIQEGKAEDALRAIRQMLSPKAMVQRDNQRMTVPAEDLVPGDIVLLQSGDKVPADLRLIQTRSLQVQEASLTGESVAVEKTVDPVDEETLLGDRICMAYSSTLVTYGQGTGVVVGTGISTEIGRISSMLARVETLTTPLLRQMNEFSRSLTIVILAIAIATFAFGILARDYTASEMFLAVVGLAVAAIPEGLPAIMTITLAIGVQRMARRNAIIRRLPAVETLGSVTVICSDKTGTLTRNEMTVQSIATMSDRFEVTGVGYDPHGSFLKDDLVIASGDYPVLNELTRASILCNDAVLQNREGAWQLEGDPTEGALMVLGMKASLDPQFELKSMPRNDVIPFESEHRFMATLHHNHSGHGFAYIKGAPERILEMCQLQRAGDKDIPINLNYWNEQMDKMADSGQRVLAIACKVINSKQKELNFSDLDTGLTLIGMVGIIDPPREEAISAVDQCQSAGIRVKMITGDHAKTANSIGFQMGIGNGNKVLTGNDIEKMDEQQLQDAVKEVDIFARSSPEHKLRLVSAMQENGDVVAMTGDGVNDAPALKRADVGTAMGQKGTEAAKEAAEIVLADDNFASITHAVEEGRTVYDNLKKAILFILPTNGGEALIIIAAIVLGKALPITPVQILWVNMITAVTLALTLAFEPSEKNVMQRQPRESGSPLLSKMFIWRITFVSLILMTGTFGMFLLEQYNGASIEQARTVAVNTLVMFEIFYLFNSRYIFEPVLNREGLFGNKYVLIAIGLLILFQILFTYTGPMQTMFGTTSIDLLTWCRIILVTSSVLFLVEIEKTIHRRRFQKV